MLVQAIRKSFFSSTWETFGELILKDYDCIEAVFLQNILFKPYAIVCLTLLVFPFPGLKTIKKSFVLTVE